MKRTVPHALSQSLIWMTVGMSVAHPTIQEIDRSADVELGHEQSTRLSIWHRNRGRIEIIVKLMIFARQQ